MTTKTVKCQIMMDERSIGPRDRASYVRDRLVRMLASEIAGVLITCHELPEHRASYFEASVDISFKDAQ